MKILNAGLTEYNEALKNLNDKLVAIGKYIEVRAIGGYAMLYNGLRSGGYTVDVDTVTEDYSDDIKRLVVEVSEEEGIEDDWLNNDAYSLEEVMGIFDELEWIRDKSYSNIPGTFSKAKTLGWVRGPLLILRRCLKVSQLN